ncbi:MAG: hypothetical protein MRJ93_13910 [Nitrososphaeraceae archaeon]|nr:hypothetical protein [Nitrososphaeraceae archaeon]
MFGNLSKPAKIGVILILAGVGIVGIGTGMGDESVSYYGLLIIVTGLFIYLAYNYNFTGKFGKTKYPFDEKKKKRRK